jgi:hypothetical protein
MENPEFLKSLATPIIAAMATIFGIGFWTYKSLKPKSVAEANKLAAETESLYAKGWEELYRELKSEIKELRKEIAQKDKDHALELQKKDVIIEAQVKQITDQNKEISDLKDRVFRLETDLKQYQGINVQVETARENIHEAVEENMDNIKT